MPRWSYVQQATQPMLEYLDALDRGDQIMAERKFQDANRALDALQQVAGIQQARQTMQYQREMHPLLMGQQRAVTGQAQVGLQQAQMGLEQTRRQEQEYAEIAKRYGTTPYQADLVAKLQQAKVDSAKADQIMAQITEEGRQGYIPARVGAAVAGERATGAEAVTREAEAVAKRPYVGIAAEAAGAEALLRKGISESEIRNLPYAETAKRFQLQSDAVKAQLQRGLDFYDLGRVVQIKRSQQKLLDAEIERLIAAGELDRATALQRIAALEEVDTESLNRAVGVAEQIRQTYMAIASLERGTVDWGMISALKEFRIGVPRDEATIDLIKQRLWEHVWLLRSAINQYGYDYDNTSDPPVIRRLGEGALGALPVGGETTGQRFSRLRQGQPTPTPQARLTELKKKGPMEDVEGAYAAGQRGAGPPTGMTPEDLKNIMDAFGLKP